MPALFACADLASWSASAFMVVSLISHGDQLSTQQIALDAYITRTAAIHAKLARLPTTTSGATRVPSVEATGDLGRVKSALDDLLAIFGGEQG